jgi:pyruvate dehydrogenase E1 component alpha subunit
MRPFLADAFVFSNHRGHGHYLAKFDDPAGLLAEITGRAGAVCGGVGGSQHVYRDGFCSTGVQGESLPVALGVAMHRRTSGRHGLVAAYIGDGTWGQGVVYETLNLAALWRAPLLVLVENNGIAQTTPIERHLSGTIAGRAAAFGVRYVPIDTSHIPEIRDRLAEPVAATLRGEGPLVVEFTTARLGPHSKGDDTRPPEVVRRLAERDWCAQYAARCPAEFEAADARARDRIEAVARDVLARPLAGWPR